MQIMTKSDTLEIRTFSDAYPIKHSYYLILVNIVYIFVIQMSCFSYLFTKKIYIHDRYNYNIVHNR